VTTPPLDAEALRRFLVRKFLTATIGGRGSILVAQDPDAAADVAMSVVGPFLERLRAENGAGGEIPPQTPTPSVT